MTDEAWLEFIKSCTLSNEEIAEFYGHPVQYIRNWRNGKELPEPKESRTILMRELIILEHTRLSEQIQAHNAKRVK